MVCAAYLQIGEFYLWRDTNFTLKLQKAAVIA